MRYLTFKTADSLAKYFCLNCEVTILEGAIISIEKSSIFDVSERLVFKGDVLIRDNTRIAGRDIMVGHKFYMDHHAEIGGGSCYGKKSKLRIGTHFHISRYSMINTSREVTIGNEVGMRGNIFTHGAYLNVLDGFPEQWGPVHIGNHVWLPYVTILPNVTIGDNTVVASNSLVNKDIEGGGLWAGIPAKKIEGVKYPNPMSSEEKNNYLKNFDMNDTEELRRHGIRDMIK